MTLTKYLYFAIRYFQKLENGSLKNNLILFFILILLNVKEIGHCVKQISFQFDRYTTANGLVTNKIHCVFQDHKGYIWLGTPLGLIRYDGYAFKIYKHREGDDESIGKGDIWAIYEDGHNNLWIGTFGGGLNLFNRENETFIHYYKENGTGKSINDNNVNSITSDKFDNLWIATGYGGLNCYNLKSKKFTYYINNPENNKSIANNGVMSVFLDSNNQLWVGTWGGGLNLFDYKTNTFSRYKFDSRERSNGTSNVVWTINEDHKHNLWIGTWGSGLLLFDRKVKSFSPFLVKPINTASNSDNVILAITEDAFGNLWIGTELGLKQFDRNKKMFMYPKIKGGKPNEDLTYSAIYALFNDNQGILWIGTFGDGLNVIDNYKLKFNLIEFTGKLTGNWVNCAYDDENNTIWLGAGGVGIVKYNKTQETFDNFNSVNYKLPAKFVSSICSLNPDSLLLSTYYGFFSLNKKNNSIDLLGSDFNTKNSTILSFDNQCVYFGNENKLIQYNIRRKLFNKIVSIDSNATISCFILGLDSVMWIGSDNKGVYRYDSNTKKLTNYCFNSKRKFDISDNNTRSLFQDKQGNIWIATSYGLNKLNPKTLSLKVFTEKDGLPSTSIFYMIGDSAGNIWISTERGVSQLDIKLGRFTNYIVQEGLPEITPRFFKSSKNKLIMTGSNGFCIFNPSQIHKFQNLPPVYLTEFKLFNNPVEIGAKGSPLKQHISVTTEMELNYKQSVISFGWVALNYRLPEKVQYSYKMEGFEKEWNYMGTIRSATYTNLNPGKYIFRVKASNNDGVWNENGVSLKISILPPFWQTWWFKIVLILLIVFTTYSWYRYRVWRLMAQKAILQKKVDQRTADINNQKEELAKQADRLQEANFLLTERSEELEAASEELHIQSGELYRYNEELIRLNSTKDRLFAIIGHDLRNPFNAIMNYSQLLSSKFEKLAEEKKRHMIDNILTSSVSAYKLLENLLEWAHSNSYNNGAKPKDINLKNIINKTTLLLNLQAESKTIRVVSEISGLMNVYADPSMIETIIRNFLSNAIKFTQEGGEIIISAREIEDLNILLNIKLLNLNNEINNPLGTFVELSVSDNGIGMSAEVLENLFRIEIPHFTPGTAGERGTGLGLILCSEFASKNFGKVTVKSEVGKGSTFYLYLPKNKQQAEELQKIKNSANKINEVQKPETSDRKLLDAEGEKYQILLVEDNPQLLKHLAKDLSIGFHVHTAQDGKQGIEMAFQLIPNIIITDLMMPYIDGIELCKIVKSDDRTSHIPIIILTAKRGEENHLVGLETGANDYLLKPFSIKLLKLKVRNLLEMQQKLRERYVKQVFIGPSDIPYSNLDEEFIKRAIEVVEKNISNVKFSVENFSDQMNMSYYQLYRKLSAITNLFPADFIRSIRLKRAAQLISKGDLNINQICYETGFNDHSYFSKCFKKEFGVTPKEYGQK